MSGIFKKFGILLLVMFLFVTYAQTTRAQSNSETQSPEMFDSISHQLKSYPNKLGRVSLSNVNALSLQSKDKDEEVSYQFGVSFLTQKDIVVSPGVGAVLSF